MHDQVNRDMECSFVAGEILKMRAVMSLLVEKRTRLGDHEPIRHNQMVRGIHGELHVVADDAGPARAGCAGRQA